MTRKIKLIAESLRTYVFVYEDTLQDDFPRGFICQYDRIKGGVRDRDRCIGSIENHCPYWFDHEPTTVFTPEDLERIANLPIGEPKYG